MFFTVLADQIIDKLLFGRQVRRSGGELLYVVEIPAVFILGGISDQHRIMFATCHLNGDLPLRPLCEAGIIRINTASETPDASEIQILEIRQPDFGSPAPFGGTVESPGDQAPPSRFQRLFSEIGAVLALQIGGQIVEFAAVAVVSAGVLTRIGKRAGQFRTRFAARTVNRSGITVLIIIDRIAADQEKSMPLRCDQPPAAVDFLFAETAGRFKTAGVKPSAEPVEFCRIKGGNGQFRRFPCCIGAQFHIRFYFAGPFLCGNLAVAVYLNSCGCQDGGQAGNCR